ncbi:unnamed protein product [Prunus armeniaca]
MFVAGLKFINVDRPFAEKHYEDLSSKPFFSGLIDYIISGPVIAMTWEGNVIPNRSLEKMLSSGARAPSEAQEILVRRGGVAGTVPSLKTESVVMGRHLGLDLAKVEIVGVGGSIQFMMCKFHIGEYNNNPIEILVDHS